MQLVFRPEAKRELLDAQAWYEERSPGLGFEFARAVDVAVAKALRMPEAYSRMEGDYRRVATRKFPYSIIYHVSDLELIVVSCFHQRRAPGSWRRNIEG